ncbi:shieldin complex subunit 1 isoform X2 [Ahaetulla prasina]|uniref:shieldin complex subunit 1 isoform X2 n=1 Tax=Ahaetulla prasina TaxID=499056 RepID=UPI0026499AE7|nr:shieldin complex subunit 1 isoform X2 [Ahaetulla prasina]
MEAGRDAAKAPVGSRFLRLATTFPRREEEEEEEDGGFQRQRQSRGRKKGARRSVVQVDASASPRPKPVTAARLKPPSPGGEEGKQAAPRARYFPTEPSNRFLPGPDAKGNITQWPYRYERREPVSCENTEHLQHSEIAVPEQRGEGESTLRKSLDTFYRTLCQKKPSGGSPRYESTSQCLSLKTVDLAGKEGMKFVVKNLQIAQMVLNREENKIFPQPPCNHFCLLTPVSADANSEKGKAIPGLSDDVLQFILKQNALK